MELKHILVYMRLQMPAVLIGLYGIETILNWYLFFIELEVLIGLYGIET